MEEKHGLTSTAMSIYERASKLSTLKSRWRCVAKYVGRVHTPTFCSPQVFNIYTKKSEEHFGIMSTREIYDKAAEVIPDEAAR